MKQKLVGLIRVITIKDEELLNVHGRIIEEHFPELRVVTKCIPDQPRGIYDEESERKAIPKIVNLGMEMADTGIKALIISCAADPGVKELREKVSIPVIGAGSASAHIAASISDRIGVLTLTNEIPRIVSEVLNDKIRAWTSPAGVKNTLDLMKSNMRGKIIEAAISLVEKNCEAILLACTGFSTIKIADEIRNAVSIPVIDPVVASGAIAWMLLKET